MQSKSAALRDQINEWDAKIQAASNLSERNQLESERNELNNQLQAALADEARQQSLEQQLEEDVRDNGYVLDTLEVDGFTAPEIITDDGQYNLIRKGVQRLVVGMNLSHTILVNTLQAEQKLEVQTLVERAAESESKVEKLQTDNKDLEVKNYELSLENEELSEKVRKVAELQHETNQQIEQQKQHIDELQKQLALGIRGALNVVEMPQDTSVLAAEINAKKVRITNVKFKDEFGIDRRFKTAVEVLSGKEIEYEGYTEKRYIILDTPEKVEQYRVDEANKKAEQDALQAAIPTLEVPDVPPVNDVVLKDEAAAIQPFPAEIQSTESTMVEGSSNSDREVATEESEVVTRAEFIKRLVDFKNEMLNELESNYGLVRGEVA